jgi:hypothetical protein
MLAKGGVRKPEDVVVPEEEIKSPYVLEFLNLKDDASSESASKIKRVGVVIESPWLEPRRAVMVRKNVFSVPSER